MEWIFEEVDNKIEGQRMIKLELLNQETLNQMFSRGASRIVSKKNKKINPETEQLVLVGAKIGCGVCGSLEDYPLPNPLKLCMQGYFDVPSVHVSNCPTCGSINEIRGHTTKSNDRGQEYWILTRLSSYPEKYKGSPYLGWPILSVDEVSVETQSETEVTTVAKTRKKWWKF